MTGKNTIIIAAIAALAALEPGSSALGDCGGCKAKFERTKPHANVGTIGHVDHNRTNAARRVELRGFGAFSVKKRSAHVGSSHKNQLRLIKSKQGHRLAGRGRKTTAPSISVKVETKNATRGR